MRFWEHDMACSRTFICLILIGFLAGCGQPTQSSSDAEADQAVSERERYEKLGSWERPPYLFYRVEADFILKETGEPVRFDYVAGCGGVVFSNAGTSGTSFMIHNPILMAQAVGPEKQSALAIGTPDMCDNWSWKPPSKYLQDKYGITKRIPDDFRPMAIWFDDVNDLSFGWGYKTDDAYESPLAKIEFLGASITRTDEAAWRAWREQAEAEYEQIGAIPGPWGYNYSHDPIEIAEEIITRGKGYGIVGTRCIAQARIPVRQDLIEEIFALASGFEGRYLNLDTVEGSYDLIGADKTAFGDGQSIRHFRAPSRYRIGTLTRDGGGYVVPPAGPEDGAMLYRDVFPILPRSRSMPEGLSEPQDVYYRRILIADEYKGFGACDASHPMDNLTGLSPSNAAIKRAGGDVEPFDPEARAKTHLIYVGEELAGEDTRPLDHDPSVNALVDREGFIYVGDY